AESAKAAPIAVMVTATSGAAGIAKGAMWMMKLAFWKTVAAAVIGVVVVITGCVAVAVLETQPASTVVAATAPASAPAGDVPLDLVEVRKHIIAAEKALHNVRVKSTSKYEWWHETEEKWVLNGESRGTSTRLAVPASKMRLDFDAVTTQWVQGAYPWITQKKIVAYNGRVGQELELGFGPSEQEMKATSRGTLTRERPAEDHHGKAFSGWIFTVQGKLDSSTPRTPSLRVSELFEDKFVEVTARRGEFGGVQTVDLVVDFTQWDERWILYLDPSRQYALLGYEELTRGQVTTKWTIEKLVEAAPGIFYPTEVMSESFRWGGASYVPFSRGRYVATEVVVNDPNFSEAVFDIYWPEGCIVYDMDTERVQKIKDGKVVGDD
ncbi:MAG: hypothetical protein FWD53_06325, partial [Phycisphaerales bacterium]|nr:hypothetical protein [Phycisphaerales bacterium]